MLTEVLSVLELANQNDSASQKFVAERMQVLVANVPDIVLYFIFVFVSREQPTTNRQRAGLYLKQHFRQFFTKIRDQHADQLNAIRVQLEQSILDPNQTIRETAGNVLTFLIQKQGLPQSFETIRRLTDGLAVERLSELGGAFERLDGAFGCLEKIVEDAVDGVLQYQRERGVTPDPNETMPLEHQHFLQFAGKELLPKVMQFGSTEAPLTCRRHALKLTNHFALNWFLDSNSSSEYAEFFQGICKTYFEMLGKLAQDEDVDVLCGVVNGFNVLLHGQEGGKSCIAGGRKGGGIVGWMYVGRVGRSRIGAFFHFPSVIFEICPVDCCWNSIIFDFCAHTFEYLFMRGWLGFGTYDIGSDRKSVRVNHRRTRCRKFLPSSFQGTCQIISKHFVFPDHRRCHPPRVVPSNIAVQAATKLMRQTSPAARCANKIGAAPSDQN